RYLVMEESNAPQEWNGMFSNIENNMEDEMIAEVMLHWREIVTFSDAGVFVALYQKPKFCTLP
ncbi:MAG: hypothetical protein ACPGU0_00775, partial [Marinirhabdus sp.]